MYRTLLFMPASKMSWLARRDDNAADAIIIDLEDSVPHANKIEARDNVRELLKERSKKPLLLRINKELDGYNSDDISLASHGIAGILLPKVSDVADISSVHNTLCDLEKSIGLAPNSIALLPMLETAKALWLAFDIASHERVTAIIGISSKNGDVERSLGTRWTPQGLETLYLKSRTVMAARAAGKIPIGGLWQDVHNTDGLREAAAFNRQLGFDGELVLHPSNAEIVNEAYALTAEERAYYEGLIIAFEEAEALGTSALMYQGDHIDYAHVKQARQQLNKG